MIDFTIDVCVTMSQALRVAEDHAAADDYDAYEQTLQDVMDAASPAGAVIAGMFLDKLTHAAQQVLFEGIPADRLAEIIDHIDATDGADLNHKTLTDIVRDVEEKKNTP